MSQCSSHRLATSTAHIVERVLLCQRPAGSLVVRTQSPVSYTHLDVYKRQVGETADIQTEVVVGKKQPVANRYEWSALPTQHAVSYTHLVMAMVFTQFGYSNI